MNFSSTNRFLCALSRLVHSMMQLMDDSFSLSSKYCWSRCTCSANLQNFLACLLLQNLFYFFISGVTRRSSSSAVLSTPMIIWKLPGRLARRSTLATVTTFFFLDGLSADFFGDVCSGGLALADLRFIAFFFLVRTGLVTCLMGVVAMVSGIFRPRAS